jgi:hypothetical protein
MPTALATSSTSLVKVPSRSLAFVFSRKRFAELLRAAVGCPVTLQ